MAYSGDLEAMVLDDERVSPREATDAYLTSQRRRAPTTNDGEATQMTGVKMGREFRGATVQEAVAAASTALGVDKGTISFEALDRGSGGFWARATPHRRRGPSGRPPP